MLLIITCLFAAAAAAPTITYDRRQDGEYNTQLDVSNILFVMAVPKNVPASILDLFSKQVKPGDKNQEIQDRSDIRVMEAFVEPNKPYRVEIGDVGRSGESNGRAVEVVIAGRRRLETEQTDTEEDDLKLLGATENCGLGRVRDSVTLMCKDIETVEEAESVVPTKQNTIEEHKPSLVPS